MVLATAKARRLASGIAIAAGLLIVAPTAARAPSLMEPYVGPWEAVVIDPVADEPRPTSTAQWHPVVHVAARPDPPQTPRTFQIRPSTIAATATWYCLPGTSRCHRGYPSGLYAAISPDLWRLYGQRVRVCYRTRCVTVKIIDCNCQAHRAIDLYADAFRKLAPLSAGRIQVTLSH